MNTDENIKVVDFVQATTARYNNLIQRNHEGELISSTEWRSCAQDLREAGKQFTDDRAYFCTSRATDCDSWAFSAEHFGR